MKHTRFSRIFSLVACFLLAATTVFAQPGGNQPRGDFPDISYSAALARSVQSDCMEKILAMPEFQEFFNALTARIDAEYVKVSNQSAFPAPVADYFLDKVRDAKGKTEISSKDVIELLFTEFELVQLEAFAKKAYDAGAVKPGQNNPDVGKYVRLTVVTKFPPAELGGIVDFIPPFITMDMIKAMESDFLVSFSVPGQTDVKLFVGGQRLEGRSDYVTVLSLSREMVEQKLTQMQNERFRQFLFSDNAPFETIRLGKGVFDVLLAETQKKIDAGTANPGDNDFIRILEQVNSFSMITRDIDGKTGTVIRLALTNEDAAEGLKDLANGGKAFLRFMAGSATVDADAKKLINFVLDTEIVRDGTNLTATINWSNEAFLDMLKDGFKKGIAEINK
ncbi:MAG: hypothetical protein FWH27_15800 [Planctomycetaceae bacterium]|nr:hypothetical protein [Planctomycetaceae bacterium]